MGAMHTETIMIVKLYWRMRIVKVRGSPNLAPTPYMVYV